MTPEKIIEKTIRAFPFWDYGMDDVDPRSKYAEWVPALAAAIVAALSRPDKEETTHE